MKYKLYRIKIQLVLILSILYLNNTKGQTPKLFSSYFSCALELSKDTLVRFNLSFDSSLREQYLITANHATKIGSWKEEDDSVFIVPSEFHTEIRAKYNADKTKLIGMYFDYTRVKDYRLPFSAELIKHTYHTEVKYSEPKRWKIIFDGDTVLSHMAIGLIQQNEEKLSAAFLSTSGDYGFFNGVMHPDYFEVSSFDGSHAFWFGAKWIGKDSMSGVFRSGPLYYSSFSGHLNPTIELPPSSSFTGMKEGFDEIKFSFPDIDSNFVRLSDDRYKGKVVIIQLSGSWCSNCRDEIQFLLPLYQKLHPEGLEIIEIDFERKADWKTARKAMKHEKETFHIPYTIVWGGTVAHAIDSLPMLKNIPGYPTLIFIGRNGKVKHIESGINGPATGKLWDIWKNRMYQLTLNIIKEK